MIGLEGFALAGAGKFVSPLLQAAADAVQKKLSSAREGERQNAGNVVLLLESASIIMNGLEGEVDQLLLAAKHQRSEEDAQAILARLDDLLYREELRPLLAGVSARLDILRDSLHDRGKPARQQVISDLGRICENIQAYLLWLESGSHLTSGSAPWRDLVLGVRSALENKDYFEASRLAGELLDNRLPLAVTRSYEINRLVQQLQTSFR
jgi:hypothetical protein